MNSKILTPEEWANKNKDIIADIPKMSPVDGLTKFSKLYAKYYHKAQVESMTDDVIEECCTYKSNVVNKTGGVFTNWREVDKMKQMREELLKKNKNFEG